MENNSSSNKGSFGIITVVYILLGLVAIYYLYRYLNTSANSKSLTLFSGKQAATSSPSNIPTIPTLYEGGEYSVNTWVYISSFNKNRNTRKHIFELKGDLFSSLLIGLGAFNNTLMVRTHTKSATDGFRNYNTGGTGGGTAGGTGGGNNNSTTTAPPNASDNIGNLSASSVDSLFTPLAMEDSLLDTPPICDLPEIDLQRWTMITVVLTGRTIDVYIDGKLSRSCMGASYYKVDPTGVKAVMTDRGGFDGYTGNTSVANYSMNPDEIYRAYLSGPEYSSIDPFSWFISLFKGSS
jgi:hypothetical protein